MHISLPRTHKITVTKLQYQLNHTCISLAVHIGTASQTLAEETESCGQQYISQSSTKWTITTCATSLAAFSAAKSSCIAASCSPTVLTFCRSSNSMSPYCPSNKLKSPTLQDQQTTNAAVIVVTVIKRACRYLAKHDKMQLQAWDSATA